MKLFLFQFPSNGKVLSDQSSSLVNLNDNDFVSIPFKRESPFGHEN